eukprot:SM000040S14843  [mRNA]  locus=s40:781462:785148:+ [translate_table: standard]
MPLRVQALVAAALVALALALLTFRTAVSDGGGGGVIEGDGGGGSPELSVNTSLQLVRLELAAQAGAGKRRMCLDGTPPAIYVREGSGTGASRWNIHFEVLVQAAAHARLAAGSGFSRLLGRASCHSPGGPCFASADDLDLVEGSEEVAAGVAMKSLPGLCRVQGGGWCNDESECLARSYTSLGSTANIANDLELGGFFSSDPEQNPDFYSWNVAYMKYCDGASFSGDVEEPVNVMGRKLYFRGKRILDAVIDELHQKRGLADANQVIISGCSAGGLAAYMHCDYLRARLPASATVKCLPDSGVFLDIKDVAGRYHIREKYKYVYYMQGANAGANEACLADKAAEDQYQCFFAQYTLPYIKTPTFVLNSNYDSWSLVHILAPASADPDGSRLRACLSHLDSCTEQQLNRLQGFRSSMLDAIAPVTGPHHHGAFAFSCIEHCTLYNDEWWSRLRVSNVSLRDAFGDWFFERGGTNVKEDCPLPCNNCGESDDSMTRSVPVKLMRLSSKI